MGPIPTPVLGRQLPEGLKLSYFHGSRRYYLHRNSAPGKEEEAILSVEAERVKKWKHPAKVMDYLARRALYEADLAHVEEGKLVVI